MTSAASTGSASARSMDSQSIRDVVASSHVVVCCGSGGVGKTTTAAVIALEAARQGRRAVVVTNDPARRLADALVLANGRGHRQVRCISPTASSPNLRIDTFHEQKHIPQEYYSDDVRRVPPLPFHSFHLLPPTPTIATDALLVPRTAPHRPVRRRARPADPLLLR